MALLTFQTAGTIVGRVSIQADALTPFRARVGIGSRQDYLSLTITVISPLPGTVILTSLTLPKTFDMTEVPGIRGAVGSETVFAPFTMDFDGMLYADTPEELATVIETAMAFLDSEDGMYLEVFPGRHCVGRVQQHTLDPKWVGANDTTVSFSFTVVVPDAVFLDDDGNTYRTP